MRLVVLWSIAMVLTLAAVVATAPSAVRARAHAVMQSARVAQVDGLVQRISARRTTSPAWAARDSGASLPERLATAVAAAGLPANVLVSVSPGAEEQLSAEPPLRRQKATVLLGGLTLPQLAKVLDQWRTAEPAWVVSAIEIAPEKADSKSKAEPGADLPLRTTLGIERVAPGEQP